MNRTLNQVRFRTTFSIFICMKKALLILGIIILLPITASFDAPLREEGVHEILFVKKADFRTALHHLLSHEGYYVNDPDDRGKETYGGISRKYNPNWWGWRFIDDYKLTKGQIKRYTRFPELDFWVLDYYLDIWIKEQFYLLRDQQVANYVLDFRVNGTVGARLINKTLIQLGHSQVRMINRIDSVTIESINATDKYQFLNTLKDKRVSYYKRIVSRDTTNTQHKYLKHWLYRAENI